MRKGPVLNTGRDDEDGGRGAALGGAMTGKGWGKEGARGQRVRSAASGAQPVDDGFQVECCLADPNHQHGAAQIKARPRQDLALAT